MAGKGGRIPNAVDMRRMQRAISYVTAYDMGIEEQDFTLFLELVREEKDHEQMMQSLAQFTWLLLKSIDESGYDKRRVLGWYGKKFALTAEEMGGD